MIKKIMKTAILCCATCYISLNIAEASKLTDMVKEQTQTEVISLKEQTFKQDSNIKVVTLQAKDSGFRMVAVTNKQETFLLPITQGFFTANDADRDMVIQEYNSATLYNMTFKTHDAVKKSIATLPKEAIIDLKSTNPQAKKVFYIVSDPQCPHCQNELKNIKDRLNQGDVKMIIVGMMGEESVKKAGEIYDQVKNAKSDSDKINILQKIYNDKYKAKGGNKALVDTITKALIAKGKVEATPYILEEDKK